MRRHLILLVCAIMALALLAGCGKADDAVPEDITVNELSDIACTKLLAESKVIEKAELPGNMANLAEIDAPEGVELSMITEVYTKSDLSKEDFDVLHDYSFLFSDDGNRVIMISASEIEKPLRDYFFQGDNKPSEIGGTSVIISNHEDRYFAEFSADGIFYDVETGGLSLEELCGILEQIISR